MAERSARAAERLMAANLVGREWAEEAMAQCRAHVGSLLQPSGKSGHGSPLIALDED